MDNVKKEKKQERSCERKMAKDKVYRRKKAKNYVIKRV